MQGSLGRLPSQRGARSGIGQVLAIEWAGSGVQHAISDVDTEGLAITEERLKAIGAPVKADRLDVTEREAVFHAVNAHSLRPTRPTTTRAPPSPVTSKAASSRTFGQVTDVPGRSGAAGRR